MVSIVSIRHMSVITAIPVFVEMMKIMHYVRPGNVFQGHMGPGRSVVTSVCGSMRCVIH